MVTNHEVDLTFQIDGKTYTLDDWVSPTDIDFDPWDCPLELGRWFKRWDADTGRFVNNQLDTYPND